MQTWRLHLRKLSLEWFHVTTSLVIETHLPQLLTNLGDKSSGAVGHVYVVGAAHPEVLEVAATDQEKFTVARPGSIAATEEMLNAVADELGTFVLG